MHIENSKLKYNQTIVTWKGLHQHPMTNLAAHHGAEMAFCHVLLLFNLSSFQEEFTI
jgi:hypothetical protein